MILGARISRKVVSRLCFIQGLIGWKAAIYSVVLTFLGVCRDIWILDRDLAFDCLTHNIFTVHSIQIRVRYFLLFLSKTV